MHTYLAIKWHLDPPSRLAATDIGWKLRATGSVSICPPPFLGPHLTQCGLGRGYFPTKFHLDLLKRLATMHQRHRQYRTGQTRQQSDSIGRTVFRPQNCVSVYAVLEQHKECLLRGSEFGPVLLMSLAVQCPQEGVQLPCMWAYSFNTRRFTSVVRSHDDTEHRHRTR